MTVGKGSRGQYLKSTSLRIGLAEESNSIRVMVGGGSSLIHEGNGDKHEPQKLGLKWRPIQLSENNMRCALTGVRRRSSFDSVKIHVDLDDDLA